MRAAAFALLLSGCGGAATAYGPVTATCEASEAALEAECDSDGAECTGELTTEEYRDALRCTRDLCDAIQARIEQGADE